MEELAAIGKELSKRDNKFPKACGPPAILFILQ